MKDHVRAAVAAIALAYANRRKVSSVYCYSGGSYRNIERVRIGKPRLRL